MALHEWAFARKKERGILGGFVRRYRAVGRAQIGPIYVRAEILAANGPAGFTFDLDAEIRTKLLANRTCFSEVSECCTARLGEGSLPIAFKRIQIGAKTFHARRLPDSNIVVNTLWCFTRRYASPTMWR